MFADEARHCMVKIVNKAVALVSKPIQSIISEEGASTSRNERPYNLRSHDAMPNDTSSHATSMIPSRNSSSSTRVNDICSLGMTSAFGILLLHLRNYKQRQKHQKSSKSTTHPSNDTASGSPKNNSNNSQTENDREFSILNGLAAMLMSRLLPADIIASKLTWLLMQEVVAGCCLKPLAELLAEPDFLNTLMLEHLDFERDRLRMKTRRGFCVLRIRLLRGRNFCLPGYSSPSNNSTEVNSSSQSNSSHCIPVGSRVQAVFCMAGRKLKSKKLKLRASTSSPSGCHSISQSLQDSTSTEHKRETESSSAAALATEVCWREEFRFKVPDSVIKSDPGNAVTLSVLNQGCCDVACDKGS